MAEASDLGVQSSPFIELVVLQLSFLYYLVIHAKVVALEQLLEVVVMQQLLVILDLHCCLLQLNHVLSRLLLANVVADCRRAERWLHRPLLKSFPVVVLEPHVRLELLDAVEAQASLRSPSDAQVYKMGRFEVPIIRHVLLFENNLL